jgi:S1-C subfamily serine protease
LGRIFTLGLAIALTTPAFADEPTEVRDRGVAATVHVSDAADATSGSGVIIARSGGHAYVLTAQHVAPKADTVEVRTTRGKPVKAEVLARSAQADLAVLRFAAVDLPAPVSLGATGKTPEQVISVGWEEGATPMARAEEIKGTVRLRRPGESSTVLCWEAAHPPANGRSGGPLIDQAGRVVGIASGHDGTAGYYVHVDEIHAFLKANALRWLTEDDR